MKHKLQKLDFIMRMFEKEKLNSFPNSLKEISFDKSATKDSVAFTCKKLALYAILTQLPSTICV